LWKYKEINRTRNIDNPDAWIIRDFKQSMPSIWNYVKEIVNRCTEYLTVNGIRKTEST
jgi:hypothetical protein